MFYLFIGNSLYLYLSRSKYNESIFTIIRLSLFFHAIYCSDQKASKKSFKSLNLLKVAENISTKLLLI